MTVHKSPSIVLTKLWTTNLSITNIPKLRYENTAQQPKTTEA
jgi:hypothetical protein